MASITQHFTTRFQSGSFGRAGREGGSGRERNHASKGAVFLPPRKPGVQGDLPLKKN